ncbi:Small-subunit processome [Elaphomyces granulatus]|jgi:U3 small nucleolar RNA-associated protein 11
MSSMRNAVHRRQHRERGQLKGREKWGILEKHKDYALRAQDYNVKKAKLQRLREKARDRNPDEFAFGMLSERNRTQGRHGAREATALSHDAIKLLKTQDAGYLRVVGERVRRQVKRLEEDVNLQEGMREILTERQPLSVDDNKNQTNRKVIFAESRDQQQKLGRIRSDDNEVDSDLEQHEDEEVEPEDADGDTEGNNDPSFGQQLKATTQQTKSKKQVEAESRAYVELRAAKKLKRRAAEIRSNKLDALRKQYTEITAAEKELDWQRARMTNSVGGVSKHGIKWKIRERKK